MLKTAAASLSPSRRVSALDSFSGALAFLALYAAIWTIFAVLSGMALHRDMTEAYSWGREFQLGYYKHPPFWAWIAGLWFKVFPRTDWAFYLLATLNMGVGVLGVWFLTGLFTRGPFRTAAALLLLSIPFYTVQAHKFNANFMLVSLWPWTGYFFVRSIERKDIGDAILFGAFAAASLLSKYYSALLLFSCFLASLLHPYRNSYYRSAAPYVTAAICALLVAPHIWWLTQHDYQTLTYVETRTSFSGEVILEKGIAFIFGSLAFGALPFAIVSGVRLWGGSPPAGKGEAAISPDRRWFAAILGLGPFVLTVLSAILAHVRLSTNFASPIFFLVPLLLIERFKPKPELLLKVAAGAAACFAAIALAAAPFVYRFQSLPRSGQEQAAMSEIAKAARAAWRQETGAPLRIAAGTEDLAIGMAFYSGEDTSAFISFDNKKSPWIADASLRRNGFLGICHEQDEFCLSLARKAAGNRGKEALLRVPCAEQGKTSELAFRLYIQPPEGASPAEVPALDRKP